jgi:hypothetical protein
VLIALAGKKIKLDDEAISEILVADTDFFFSKRRKYAQATFSPLQYWIHNECNFPRKIAGSCGVPF